MLHRALALVVSAALFTGCGGGSPEPDPPPAGRYAHARVGARLLALSLDSRAEPVELAHDLAAGDDFALPVERSGGAGRYHDLILFNGGRVYRLAGVADGRTPLLHELDTGGAAVRACGHTGGPDDAAVALVRARADEAVLEVDVRFVASTGCIDAAGERVLSIPLAADKPAVHATGEWRVGPQPDGSALGTLRVDGTSLSWLAGAGGSGRAEPLAPAPADAARLLEWQVLARDAQSVVLCARLDDARDCAPYRFSPSGSPRWARLAEDDFLRVQSAGIAGGRAYLVSSGPASLQDPPPPRLPSVHEFALDGPAAVRLALSLAPPNVPLSIDRSVLLYAQDTVLFTQYYLVDAASGATRATDFIRHGSGSSFVYADRRVGCVVANAPPASREQTGCLAEAWVTPNDFAGTRDRIVYLAGADATRLAQYAFAGVARVAGFVGVEGGADLLVAVTLADASTELWRVPRDGAESRMRVAGGDLVLYGTIRPRGSVL